MISGLPCAQGQITLRGGLDVACGLQVNQDKIPCLSSTPLLTPMLKKKRKAFKEKKGKDLNAKHNSNPPFLVFSTPSLTATDSMVFLKLNPRCKNKFGSACISL